MNITKETIKSALRGIMKEESEYQTFFKKALEKSGKSIPSMSDEEKKEFFNKIDAAWNAKGEKNEELKGNQHKLDVDGDGEIEASDLAALRAGNKKDESIEESAGCSCGCGTCSESINEATDRDFEKVYSIFDKKDYFGLKGSIKTMLGNWQRALDKGDKGAQQYSKEDVINSVTTQTKARAKHTYDELVKAIKNKDINALKSKLRHDQPFSIAIFTQTTGKKLPKSTRDIHSFLDNEFMSESITEGRAFINAAKKAKAEGKTEFEFNGKTYPVTIKESVVNEDANMNKKVKAFLDKGLRDLTKGKPNHHFAVMNVLMGALADANFHSEAKKVPSIFPKAKYEGDPMGKQDVIRIYEEMGENVASICKWDGKDIVDAIGFYVSMTIGRPVGEKVEKLVESINETIYLLNNKK